MGTEAISETSYNLNITKITANVHNIFIINDVPLPLEVITWLTFLILEDECSISTLSFGQVGIHNLHEASNGCIRPNVRDAYALWQLSAASPARPSQVQDQSNTFHDLIADC